MKDYKLYLGDCVDILNTIPDISIDLVVTSPPYDNLRTYGNKCNWGFEKFTQVANQLYRVVKMGGVIVWIINDQTVDGSETGSSFKQALYFKEIGFNIHDTMIWNKNLSSFPDKYRYPNSFEYMFVFSKGLPKSVNKIRDKYNLHYGKLIHGTNRNVDGVVIRKSKHNKAVISEYGERFNVWEIPPERHNISNHPAVFPEKLANDHIISWSDEGDTVLDPFMGSGTSGVSALKLHRKYIGIEINDEYFEYAKSRIDSTLIVRKLF